MVINNLNAATPQDAKIVSASAFDLIANASPVVQFILIMLIAFSVISWTIIVLKYIQLKECKISTARFLNKFFHVERLDAIYTLAGQYNRSPVSALFLSLYVEIQKIRKQKKELNSEIDNLQRAVGKAHLAEMEKLEKYVPFLATTASASPFVGLFGTVWGIMNSFHSIGKTGSSSLAAVAPGISEALIATAIGLAAAIPAVMAYNYFLSKIKILNIHMLNFRADVLNLIKRNI
jgi:biopolymer transport protein TolQ